MLDDIVRNTFYSYGQWLRWLPTSWSSCVVLVPFHLGRPSKRKVTIEYFIEYTSFYEAIEIKR